MREDTLTSLHRLVDSSRTTRQHAEAAATAHDVKLTSSALSQLDALHQPLRREPPQRVNANVGVGLQRPLIVMPDIGGK
jgi:hypothetical protein